MDSESGTPSLTPETKIFDKYRVAQALFEDKIVAISEQAKKDSAYDSLLAKGVEGGLAKAYTYMDPATGEELKASPVGMLNRNSFMYLVNNYVKDHGVDAVQFAVLDIGAVRQMDILGAADYNLNRIAQRITEHCKKYKNLPLLECRYGGDEFAVAIFGTLTSEQQVEFNEFQQSLQNELATITWNRKDEGENTIVSETITSKFEHSETFGSPIGDKLYSLYLQRGVILPKNEINKILREMFITQLQHNISIEDQLKRIAKKPHVYPEEFVSTESKLQYHRKKHHEYQAAIDAAVQADGKSGGTKQREFVLEFIEQVVYDQLLDDDILTFADFMDHYSENAFTDVIAVEGKFLKEANKLNYLQGDNVKFGLWDSIKKVLPANTLSHLTVANRAGSFLLGINKDTPAEDVIKISEAFKNLNTAKITIRGNTIEVPLGVSFESTTDNIQGLSAGQKVGQLREAADNCWYSQLASAIDTMQLSQGELKDIISSNKYSGIPDIGETTKEGLHILFYKGEYTFNHLLHAFFNEPKRIKERRDKMQAAVREPQKYFFDMPRVKEKKVA